ncbi:MAG: hypothetical protein H6880_03970 [Rhodobiaceae bacterium]|nr:hypothetical protein [Rhodobiaceae bacterium]
MRLAERTLTGIFSGLDDNGRLLLELPDGEMTRISAGDVFFPAPSGAGSHD